MPMPADPVRRALAQERMRLSSARRWSNPEQREHQRQKAVAQFSDPAARERMREIKLAQMANDPELLEQVRARLKAAQPLAQQARLIVLGKARDERNQRQAEARTMRLAMIRECAQGRGEQQLVEHPTQ